MDLSAAFLATARDLAAARGVSVDLVRDSCNRLRHHDAAYDVVTLSQAFHWLDRAAVAQGVQDVLVPGGRFFLVNSCSSLPADHPLHHLLEPHLPDPQAIGA